MSWMIETRESLKADFAQYPHKISPFLNQAVDKSVPLQKQFLPDPIELDQQTGFLDPIGDEAKSKGSGIIHRYQNRILFTPTTVCPVNCRYCFRKNELHQQKEFLKPSLNKLKEYLKNHPEVEEVILTGGDPLMLSDQKLDEILKICTQAKIKYLRLHTRTPVAIPSRLNSDFFAVFQKYQSKFKQMFFVLHINHTDELLPEVKEALQRIPDSLFVKLVQSVLLKGVNDKATELKALYEELIQFNFKPYYLHHPDQVRGAMHFYMTPKEGRKIYQELRTISSGWMVPHYIIDNPEGSGKQLTVNSQY